MIIFLPTFILLTIAAFSINRAIQKTPKVQPKEGTVEDPKSPTLHQALIQLSRIRNTFGEATATLVSKNHVNNQGTKPAKKLQKLRNNRTILFHFLKRFWTPCIRSHESFSSVPCFRRQ